MTAGEPENNCNKTMLLWLKCPHVITTDRLYWQRDYLLIQFQCEEFLLKYLYLINLNPSYCWLNEITMPETPWRTTPEVMRCPAGLAQTLPTLWSVPVRTAPSSTMFMALSHCICLLCLWLPTSSLNSKHVCWMNQWKPMERWQHKWKN